MRRQRRILAALAALAGLRGSPAAARHSPASHRIGVVTMEASDHRGGEQLVFHLPPGTVRQGLQHGGLVLHFGRAIVLRSLPRLPREILGVEREGAKAAIVRFAPGVGLHTHREGRRLFVDVLDPPPPIEQPRPPPPILQQAGVAAPVVVPAAPAPSLALAVQPPSREQTPDDQMADPSILLPFELGVGAAALPRGDQMLLVFDTPRPLDLAALRGDPAFASATVELLVGATLLRLRPPPGLHVVLAREPEGWRVTLRPAPPPPRAIEITPAAGALALTASDPGRVVAVVDPLDGGTLLIGTQRGAGQAIEAARQSPEFALLPTEQGVAVEPLSDRLELERTPGGFRLSGGGGPLAVAPRTLPDRLIVDADGLTRRFDLPSRSTQTLAALLRDQLAAAADAPPLRRGAPRMAAARDMIALGMGQEALGVLRVAASDDPHLADDPDLLGLEGIAAVLADDPEDARTLLDPRLSGTDEITLWRALREAMTKPTPSVAMDLASTAPLLLIYPAAIRRKLLAPALEAMESEGEVKGAEPILAARPDDPRLALARAMRDEAEGNVGAALAGYDALTVGRDRFDRVRAAMRAIDLRLARKRITPPEAITALERLDMAWRGGPTELAMRERLAELRLRTGAWRPALALLRASLTLFPDQAPEIGARMREAVTRLLRDDASKAMPPLDFVSLLEENADLLSDAAKGPEMQARLADRLLALDLPDAAAPLLERLMADAPPDAGRAATGARLAALRLAGGDGKGALAALDASAVAADLPAALTERRALLAARATALTGNVPAASAALVALGTADADRARADILEQAGDLAGTLDALTALADRVVPATGALDPPARRTLLRLAAVATRAHDDDAIAALRARIGGRFDSGDGADAMRLLLAEPVRQLADLGRSGKEVALAGSVAADLSAPPTPVLTLPGTAPR